MINGNLCKNQIIVEILKESACESPKLFHFDSSIFLRRNLLNMNNMHEGNYSMKLHSSFPDCRIIFSEIIFIIIKRKRNCYVLVENIINSKILYKKDKSYGHKLAVNKNKINSIDLEIITIKEQNNKNSYPCNVRFFTRLVFIVSANHLYKILN